MFAVISMQCSKFRKIRQPFYLRQSFVTNLVLQSSLTRLYLDLFVCEFECRSLFEFLDLVHRKLMQLDPRNIRNQRIDGSRWLAV